MWLFLPCRTRRTSVIKPKSARARVCILRNTVIPHRDQPDRGPANQKSSFSNYFPLERVPPSISHSIREVLSLPSAATSLLLPLHDSPRLVRSLSLVSCIPDSSSLPIPSSDQRPPASYACSLTPPSTASTYGFPFLPTAVVETAIPARTPL